ALREKERSAKRLPQDEGDSDTSSRGHAKGYHDDGRRVKDELDMERLQRLYSSLKQETEQLKEQLRETEREKWTLKDENQKLHCQLIKGDPLLHKSGEGVAIKGGAKGTQPLHKISSTDCDPERQQEREVQSGAKKAKSLISAPSEASDIYASSGYLPSSVDGVSNIVSILNEDVTTSVLPESFSPEQQQQLVYALQNCHSIQELISCLFSYSLSFSASSQEGLVENEQLRSKVKHLEAEHRRLSTSFDTVKHESGSCSIYSNILFIVTTILEIFASIQTLQV
ncbi:PREDICTED: uncharacterized protein LOC109592172, partial [Amphimedon queenslandica]|uniref:Uncharacterized protein n=2 Tax=Amphimedon queenslandica TaxID=400682 RepID=A0AAN0K293_AMPQE